MDLTALRPWLTLVHVLAAFGFFAVHGVSMAVMFQVRGQRDPDRIRALLDLSSSTIGAMYLFLLVLLLAGILSGIAGAWWTSGRLWIWAAVGLLFVVIVAMYAVMTRYYIALRAAVGPASPANTGEAAVVAQSAALSAPELEVMLGSSRPLVGAAIGIVGMIVIVWLMTAKPF
jgi:hypothetical protein